MIETKLWVERKFDFRRPAWMFPLLLERLRGTPARVEDRVLSLDADILTQKPDDKWSIQENIGHLVDVEELWTKRIADFKAELKELTPADMSNTKTNEADYNTASIVTVLKDFRKVRFGFIEDLEKLDEKQITFESFHPRLKQPMNIIDLMHFAASHDDHHLVMITSAINLLSE